MSLRPSNREIQLQRDREITHVHSLLNLDDNFAARLKRISLPRAEVPETPNVARATTVSPSWRSWQTRYNNFLVEADMVSALLATLVCLIIRPDFTINNVRVLGTEVPYLVIAAIFLVAWPLALLAAGSYRIHYSTFGLRDYRIPLITAGNLFALTTIAVFVLKVPLSRELVLVFFPVLAGSSLVTRWAARKMIAKIRRDERDKNRVILVGSIESVYKLSDYFASDSALDYQIVGVCVPLDQRHVTGVDQIIPILGVPDNVVKVAQEAQATSVVVAADNHFKTMSLQDAAWRLEDNGIAFFVAPMVDFTGPRIRATVVAGMPLLHVAESQIWGAGRHLKTIYERVLAVTLLVVSSPILLLISLAILIDSGRPIFYRQRRVGFAGKEFSMLKFRSMVKDADDLRDGLEDSNEYIGALFKIKGDPRVTRVGRFIRRHSLDELPQLLNVAKGEMLLVGPRPCLVSEAVEFDKAAQRRFLARPGLTGLWQVSGRSDLKWDEAVKLDLYYVENWSVLLDLLIVWRTFRVVLGGKGAY